MIHRNTKYWSFTWETNISQKKLPTKDSLINLLNKIASESIFQYEIGKVKKKVHIQGIFDLAGPRQSKTRVLTLFKDHFLNVSGLTLSPTYDKFAVRRYVTKTEGRVKGPYYGGKEEMYEEKMSSMKLHGWQKSLFEILTGPNQKKLKERKVIWVEDSCGNTGKSWFVKWLRTGQKKITVRSLPISNVDRLLSSVYLINKKHQVDAYCIDFTRTRGRDESYYDLFSAIEQIKNGYVMNVMYGRYQEAIFDPPMILIFSNQKLKRFQHFLSKDRWQGYFINSDQKLLEMILKENGEILYTPYSGLMDSVSEFE